MTPAPATKDLDDIISSTAAVLQAVAMLSGGSDRPAGPTSPLSPHRPSSPRQPAITPLALTSRLSSPHRSPLAATTLPPSTTQPRTAPAPTPAPAPSPSPYAGLPGGDAKLPFPDVTRSRRPSLVPKPCSQSVGAGSAVKAKTLGLAFPMTTALQTVQEARLSVNPGDPESHSGKLDAGSAFLSDLSAVATSVAEVSVADDEWNERWQRLLEKPGWSFERSVERGVAMSALMGRFGAVAAAAAERIVDELPTPLSLKTIKPLEADSDGDGIPDTDNDDNMLYLHQGLLLRVVSGDGGEANSVDRKVAGHELRGLQFLRWASEKLYCDWLNSVGPPDLKGPTRQRPPPLCAVLACLIDYCGYRVYAMAIPPMDEDRTLAHGRLDASTPFMSSNMLLASMLKRVGRHLNLKPHSVIVPAATQDGVVETAALTIPLSVHVQGHQCDDNRFYVMNLGRLFPPDLPRPGTTDALTRTLRPELLLTAETPVSADAFGSGPAAEDGIGEPDDAATNDVEAARLAQHLLDAVVPAFVRRLEAMEVSAYDSRSFTRHLHAAGINARYLGRVARLATLPHVREAAEVEMLARCGKVILRRHLRRVLSELSAKARASESGYSADTQSMVSKRETAAATVEFFNLCLGSSPQGSAFWAEALLPAVSASFGYSFAPSSPTAASAGGGGASSSRSPSARSPSGGHHAMTSIHKQQLFYALQYHCNVVFDIGDGSDTAAPTPTPSARLMSPFAASGGGGGSGGGGSSSLTSFDSMTPLGVHHLRATQPGVRDMWLPGQPLEHNVVSASGEELAAAGKTQEALQALNLRLGMLQAAGKGSGPDAGHALLSTAQLLADMGRHGDAYVAATDAVPKFPPRHLSSGRAHLVRACALTQSGDRDGGLRAYAIATRVAEWHVGFYHPVLAEFAMTMGTAMAAAGDVGPALVSMHQARDLAARVVGARHKLVAELCGAVGDLHRSCGDWAKAADEYRRCLDLQQSAVSATQSAASLATAPAATRAAVADTCAALADALAHNGDTASALPFAKKAFMLLDSSGEVGSSSSSSSLGNTSAVVRSLKQLAALHERAQHLTDAVSHLEIGVELAKKVATPDGVEDVQAMTRAVLRLAFRQLPQTQRSVIKQWLAVHGRAGQAAGQAALGWTISQLFASSSPSKLVARVAHAVMTQSPRVEGVPTDASTPPPTSQLLALAMLCEE